MNTNLLIALIIAFVFGFFYNGLVTRLGDKKNRNGLTAVLVVIGVAITLGFSALFVAWGDIVTILLFFVATGLPMVIGDYLRDRKKA